MKYLGKAGMLMAIAAASLNDTYDLPRSSGPYRKQIKSPLLKYQVKARAKAKRAKQARKKNR
jgi:hypothetical protein